MNKIWGAVVGISGVLLLMGAVFNAGYNLCLHNHAYSPAQCVVVPSPPALPELLTINNERWEVSRVDAVGFYGQTNCNSRTIYFNESEKVTAQHERNTMWHEIQHAARNCKEGWPDEKSNWVMALKVTGQDSPGHRKIYAEADFLANFVHDNPEFMKWAEDWK